MNTQNPLNLHNKKPRGSLNYANVIRLSMAVERMDSLRSMKNNMDPFLRTNMALLKRLDSISTLFNKDSNGNINNRIAIQENNHYFNNFHSYISQASNRFGARDTPIFRAEGVSEKDAPDRDKRMSSTISMWDAKRGSAIFIPGSQPPKKKISQNLQPVMNLKEHISKSDVSAVSVNEILDFEDYVPFRPTYNLESIDEEILIGRDKDREERKSTVYETKNNGFSLHEARMSEEESFNSSEKSDKLSEESNELSKESNESSEDDKSEYKDYLTVEPNLKPRKSSTFNSSQFNERRMKVQTKLSSQYHRQGTGNSELTMGNYSQKGGILTSICASRDGTKSEVHLNPSTLK